MRDRFLSLLVIVPALVVVFVLGEPFIALAVLAIVILGAIEAFNLLRAAGYTVLPLLGIVFAVAVVIDAAAPPELRGSSVLLAAVGLAIVGVGAFPIQDPRAGLSAWIATVFGGLYVAQLGFVIRLGNAVPTLPETAPFHALGAERGWILLLVLGVWAYDTGAYLSGRQWGRAKFLTHLSASKTYAGPCRRPRRLHGRRRDHAVGPRPERALRDPPRPAARRWPRRPATSRSRC